MSTMHQENGSTQRAERSFHEPSAELGATLETHIERIEDCFARADAHGWTHAVHALSGAARQAGAERILATASLLRSADPSDSRTITELLDRLRSDGRIFTLEQVCQRKEKALADELSAFAPTAERGRA